MTLTDHLGRKAVLVLAILLASGGAARAESDLRSVHEMSNSVRAITPIYSQLLMLTQPSPFVMAFENNSGDGYIQEMVPKGETVKAWSQMITVTGAKGLSANPNITPEKFLLMIGDSFRKACPETFNGTLLGEVKISGHDGYGLVASCGSLNSEGTVHSETAMMIAIKGQADYYTVQWAERTGASKSPIAFDQNKWMERLKKLSPIRLCPIIAGEKPPFPSCADQK